MSNDEYQEFYAPSCAETTPSQHVVENSMSAAAKRRVDRATANLTGTRCLIENTDESNAVEYAHCLPRSTASELLDSLEFAWNMPRFTLNVDTQANVIRLSSKFHKLFDSKHWLLLPESSIIDIYNEARKKGRKFPKIDKAPYRYTIVAHPTMLHVPIHRQNSLPTEVDEPPLDYTFHPHPYPDFPVIVSHVHPCFVICNAGAKLVSSTDWPYDIWNLRIQDIWKTWSRAVPRDTPEGWTFLNKPRNGDNDSEYTSNHRWEPRKRKLQGSKNSTR